MIADFERDGFVILRDEVDAARLRAEVLSVLPAAETVTSVARVQYAPMMTQRTPSSLSLIERFSGVAALLLGGPVLPVRAKGMRYFGDTAWHADSSHPIASVGFAAYLDPLDAASGALRVRPRSAPLDELALATAPGDVIVLDEHLFHASRGGGARLQWRIDYLRDPATPLEEERARAYFESVFPADWDGGYDAALHPSYPDDWLTGTRAARLRRLGAVDLARAQEANLRSQKR